MKRIVAIVSLLFFTNEISAQDLQFCQIPASRSSNCFQLKPQNDKLDKGTFLHVLFMDDQQVWYGVGKYKTKKTGALAFKYAQKPSKPASIQTAGLSDMIQIKWSTLLGEQDFFQIRILVNGVEKTYESDINTRTVNIPLKDFEAIKNKDNTVRFSLYYINEKVHEFTWKSGKGNAVHLTANNSKTFKMKTKKALFTKTKEGYLFFDEQRKESFSFVQRSN